MSYKKKEKTSKKTIWKGLIFIILLGIPLYFGTSYLTTKIMDLSNKNSNSTQTHSLLDNLETIQPISIESFLQQFNQILKEHSLPYQVKKQFQRQSNTYIYTLDDKIRLYIEPVKKLASQSKETLQMSALLFSTDYENQEEMKSLLYCLFQANNKNLGQDEIEQILSNIEKTENQKEETSTSEFFQYRGLEASKQIDKDSIRYRIGRIME